jgi:hypothetical protein
MQVKFGYKRISGTEKEVQQGARKSRGRGAGCPSGHHFPARSELRALATSFSPGPGVQAEPRRVGSRVKHRRILSPALARHTLR